LIRSSMGAMTSPILHNNKKKSEKKYSQNLKV
jgi:hypothetical protein